MATTENITHHQKAEGIKHNCQVVANNVPLPQFSDLVYTVRFDGLLTQLI
jgi:hypothetical protein